MAPRVSPPTSSVDAPAADLPLLAALCCGLRRQGYTALVVTYSDCGDTDVRLLVSCPGAPIVELLGPYNGTSGSPWWHAVRIDPEQRSLWRGPPRCGDRTRVIDFVKDLLMQPPQSLTPRYRSR